MAPKAESRAVARRQGKRTAVWLVALLLVVLTLVLVYFTLPYQGTAESIAAVEDDPQVTVEQTDIGYVIEPAERTPAAGVVFYPGGRVDPNAYVGSLAALSRDANVTVIAPEMPLNLAIIDYGLAQGGLGTHAADAAISEYDSIDRWYVGGHSLGGAMACRYARTNPELEGVLLYAAYCDIDISDSNLDVVSVAGSADTVLNWDTYEQSRDNLPASARVEVLDGLNHTQFGSYTGQDEPSGTSFETAHERLNGVVVPWLQGSLESSQQILESGDPVPALGQ